MLGEGRLTYGGTETETEAEAGTGTGGSTVNSESSGRLTTSAQRLAALAKAVRLGSGLSAALEGERRRETGDSTGATDSNSKSGSSSCGAKRSSVSGSSSAHEMRGDGSSFNLARTVAACTSSLEEL